MHRPDRPQAVRASSSVSWTVFVATVLVGAIWLSSIYLWHALVRGLLIAWGLIS